MIFASHSCDPDFYFLYDAYIFRQLIRTLISEIVRGGWVTISKETHCLFFLQISWTISKMVRDFQHVLKGKEI